MTYPDTEREQLFRGHSGRLFVLLTFVLICVLLTQRMLPPLLPAIMDDLTISAFAAGAAVSLLQIARASMEYPGGRFADQLTRTTVLVASLGFVVFGLLVLSISVSYSMFIFGVVLLGMGLGLYVPASRTLLADLFDQKRGRAFGINLMGGEIAGILAAGVAVVIVAVATWRAAFLPLALVLLPFPLVFYYLSREDVLVRTVSLEIKTTALRLFGDPSIRWLVVVYSLYIIVGSGVGTFLPTFLIEVHGVSFAFASSAFALLYIVGLLMKPVSGYLSDRLPRPVVSGSSLGIGAVGLVLLVVAPIESIAMGAVVIYAVGSKGVVAPLQAYLMDRFNDDSRGTDFGGFRTVYKVVGSLGPAYTGFIANTLGFVPAFASLIGLFLIAGGILLWFSVFGWPSSA